MIDSVLHVIVQKLDTNLKRCYNIQDSKAILGNLVDSSGSVREENENKMVLSLVNLEEETFYQAPIQGGQVKSPITSGLPFNFNLGVLASASFNDYHEALKLLSDTILFFQAQQVFTQENTPGLDPGIQRISIEQSKVDYLQMRSLWAALGTNYMPSALFKVRVLSFQGGEIAKETPVISAIDKNIKPD